MSIKKVKRYEYEFKESGGLSEILEGIFEKTGFFPRSGKMGKDYVKIVFDEPLPESSLEQLKQHIGAKLPKFKFKAMKVEERDVK